MIETERLNLIPCRLDHFAAFKHGEQQLADSLNARVADGWLVFPEAMRFGDLLFDKPELQNWRLYLFVHKADQMLIGNGGFKGAPNENGAVEIGYAIAPAYRNQNLTTEAARGLIDFAFSDNRVSAVEAHTLAEKNASCRVLEKVGMRKIAEKRDEENGDVWQWRVSRNEIKEFQ